MRNYKELLAVVLSCLLLVAAGAGHYRSDNAENHRIICQKNLHALYQAMAKYSSDNDDYIPVVVTRCRPLWKFWYDTLQSYVDSPHSFYCPSNLGARAGLLVTEGEKDLLPQVFDVHSQSYGMNYFLSTTGENGAVLHRMCDLAQPDYVIFLGDSGSPYLRATKWCWKEDYAPRHSGKINFVLGDGHCELLGKPELGLSHVYQDWKSDVKRWHNWKK